MSTLKEEAQKRAKEYQEKKNEYGRQMAKNLFTTVTELILAYAEVGNDQGRLSLKLLREKHPKLENHVETWRLVWELNVLFKSEGIKFYQNGTEECIYYKTIEPPFWKRWFSKKPQLPQAKLLTAGK